MCILREFEHLRNLETCVIAKYYGLSQSKRVALVHTSSLIEGSTNRKNGIWTQAKIKNSRMDETATKLFSNSVDAAVLIRR